MTIISQHIHISKHQVVHLKCICQLYLNFLKKHYINDIHFGKKKKGSSAMKKSFLQTQFLSIIHVIVLNISILKTKLKSGTNENL